MDFLITGSVAYDYLMSFPGYFKDHILPDHLDSISLSFLVDSMTRLRGGIAPNIAYTLALLGGHPRLWATVGEDFEEYRAWLEKRGVDTRGARVVPGVYSASFFVNTDRANAQIASFYPGAMAYAAELSLTELAENRPDIVMISPNDPEAMRQYVRECRAMGLAYIYDPSQQIVRLSDEDLHEGSFDALALFVNEYEFAMIQKRTGFDPTAFLGDEAVGGERFIVVTLGKDGAAIYTRGGVIRTPVVPAEQIIDPTGVGDAFRGGFLTGYGLGLDFETCGQMGALAGTYCLEHKGTQSHTFTPAEFVARYRQHFDDGGKLDVLLQGGQGNKG